MAVLNAELYNLMKNPLLHDKKPLSMKRRHYKTFDRDLNQQIVLQRAHSHMFLNFLILINTVMCPVCIFNHSNIQKHVDLEPNNPLMLLFLKFFELRNKRIKGKHYQSNEVFFLIEGLGDGPFDCTPDSFIDADFCCYFQQTELCSTPTLN